MATCMIVATLLLCVVCVLGDIIADTVRTLQDRIDTLSQKRQEDYKLLEEALRISLEKNAEFVSLKTEVQTLKLEVERLRSQSGGNRQKNDHLTIQWLSSSLAEVRSELNELMASTNKTAEFAARQALESQLRQVRGDMKILRRDLEQLRAGQEAALQSVREQLDHRNHKQSRESEETLTKQNELSIADKRYRHHRNLKKQIATLSSSQFQLEQNVRQLEKQMKISELHKSHTNHVSEDEVTYRITALEDSNNKVSKTLFNISRDVVGLNKLHVSMLELLESVESLENKVEKTIPEFQREISKTEFNMAQMTSTINLIKENQENQQNSVKAMGGAMSTMQEKLEQSHIRINTLESVSHNVTDGNIRSIPSQDGPKSVNLPSLVSRLTQVVDEYDAIVAALPTDCGHVNGPSGLHIVAPGPGNPIVTYCDQDTGAGGWTLMQRRQDGSQEFNKKWKEYADGFGSPIGEFWIGNEALHRLTKANMSSLRIDLVDIYGKAWFAEYSEFSVANSSDGYRINVDGYYGNASDALAYQNHMQFSAIDSDRDVSNTHCAANYEGGWWFSHCQHANLNGKYNLGLTWFDSSRNEWIAVARSEMKVRSRHRSKTPAVHGA